MADRTDAEQMPRREDAATRPDMRLEMESGCKLVAGVDEAGRGPLAGPVVCAAVKLDPAAIPPGLNDSKKLTAARREELFSRICATADCGVAVMSTGLIDQHNIRGATLLGMCRAVAALADPPELALIDGRDVPTDLCCQGTAVIGGDARSLSIAAASIVAKVVRDRLMVRADINYPGYGFAQHKGYGTKLHLQALTRLGPCPIHRHSFAPVRQLTFFSDGESGQPQ